MKRNEKGVLKGKKNTIKGLEALPDLKRFWCN
jgi:hypothetical protein